MISKKVVFLCGWTKSRSYPRKSEASMAIIQTKRLELAHLSRQVTQDLSKVFREALICD